MKRQQCGGDATQLTAEGAHRPRVIDVADATVSDATQLTDTDTQPFMYPTVPLASMLGSIPQYSICYKCGREHNVIAKNVQCTMCRTKSRTLFMVTCKESWRPDRNAAKGCRCQREGDEGIYWLTQSANTTFNRLVCCHCYGVDAPPSHLEAKGNTA